MVVFCTLLQGCVSAVEGVTNVPMKDPYMGPNVHSNSPLN